MGIRFWQVDAFAEKPFAGNPAAVVPLERPAPESWMRSLAAEMNLSETAFLWPEADDVWRLRWFTPEAEIRLCGHATLASAHVLWAIGRLDRGSPALFETLSGRLTARADGDSISMDFPAHRLVPVAPPAGLEAALGAPLGEVMKASDDLLVTLADEWAVRALTPDFGALRALGVRGVTVTAAADAGRDFDFVSRFFAPGVGIDEDPVTGSAHCALSPYWTARLGRRELVGFQASRRGGRVGVRLDGDRVQLAGRAVTVFEGELTEAAGA